MNLPLTGPSPAVIASILDYNPDYDRDTLDIFLEEGEELLVAMEDGINSWEKAPDKTATLGVVLMRTMHTMKGGSRMAGLTGLGSISHELELFLRGYTGPGTPELYAMLRSYQPVVLRGIELGRALNKGEPLPQPFVVAAAPVPAPAAADKVVAEKVAVDKSASEKAAKAMAEKIAADKAAAEKAAKAVAEKQAQEARIAQAVKDAQLAREAATAGSAEWLQASLGLAVSLHHQPILASGVRSSPGASPGCMRTSRAFAPTPQS